MPKTLPVLALTMAALLGLAGCERKDKVTTTIADSAVASGAAFDTRVDPAPVETVGQPPVAPPPAVPTTAAPPAGPTAVGATPSPPPTAPGAAPPR